MDITWVLGLYLLHLGTAEIRKARGVTEDTFGVKWNTEDADGKLTITLRVFKRVKMTR